MTIEHRHYILGRLRVRSSKMKEGQTVHLRMIHYPEATQLGFPSIGGEALAESLTVLSPDIVSVNHYNPTKGPIEGTSIGRYCEEEINQEHITRDLGCCLGSLIGYRSKIYWKPEKNV